MERIAYHLDELDEADELVNDRMPGMPLLGFFTGNGAEPGHLGRRGCRRPDRLSLGAANAPVTLPARGARC